MNNYRCRCCNKLITNSFINYLSLSVNFNGIPTDTIVLLICDDCRDNTYNKEDNCKITIKKLKLALDINTKNIQK